MIGASQIEHLQNGYEQFRMTHETLISLASTAAELFKRSKIDQRRQLIALLFSNLRLNGKNLEYSWHSPFDLTANRPIYTSWLAFLDTVRTERRRDVSMLQSQVGVFTRAA